MLKILVAEDDDLAQLGIKYILEILDLFEFSIFSAMNGSDAIDHMKNNPVDVLLLDLYMDDYDGFTVLSVMKNLQLNIPTVIFSATEDVRIIRQALNLGAKAFVSKNSENEYLGNAILSVVKGQEYLTESTRKTLQINKIRKNDNNSNKLLFKEKELIILKLLMDGMTSKEIASYLFLSPRTVEGHRAKLMRKTETKSMLELAKYVTTNNLKLIGKA